jgi:prolyl-tRNA editing enzyme YbaK/EbsC (Cys-tRNA(Pro) deacylase)
VAEIIKSVLVNVGGQPVLVVTCGDTKINSSKLKRAMNLSGKVRFATVDEVVHYTGYPPGSVTPFLLPAGLPVLIDRSIHRFSTIYPAAGDDHSAVSVTIEQLLSLTGGTEVDVCDLRRS